MKAATTRTKTTTSETASAEGFSDRSRAIAHAVDDIAREAWAMRHGAACLVPGYVLIAELSSQGGSTAENYKTETDKKTQSRRISFTKKVDNTELDEMATRVIAGARYVLDTHTCRFFAGTYFVPEDGFEEIDQLLEEARQDAEKCNKAAREMKSERRTIVEVYRLLLDPADKRLALRLGASIHKRLITLRGAYTSAARRGYQTAMIGCMNLHKLVGGSQREMIRLALSSAESQRPIMIAHYGGRKGVGEIRRENGGRIPDFDYGPIDAAIALFAPAAAS